MRLLSPSEHPQNVDERFRFSKAEESSDGLGLISLHQRQNRLGAVLPFLSRLDGGSEKKNQTNRRSASRPLRARPDPVGKHVMGHLATIC